jgi:BMFP domain-containing protein YqiC
MIDPKNLDELSSKLSAMLAATPARDFEKNAKAMLASMLGRLDIVTRDEFDVQTQVLARTREKLTALEARVGALEKQLSGK